jgi:hypothetical protein
MPNVKVIIEMSSEEYAERLQKFLYNNIPPKYWTKLYVEPPVTTLDKIIEKPQG